MYQSEYNFDYVCDMKIVDNIDKIIRKGIIFINNYNIIHDYTFIQSKVNVLFKSLINYRPMIIEIAQKYPEQGIQEVVIKLNTIITKLRPFILDQIIHNSPCKKHLNKCSIE